MLRMAAEELTWETSDDPDPEAVRVVDEGLGAFNAEAADTKAIRRFACFARDAEGRVVGGALARTWGTSCEIQVLWVARDLRDRGIGRRLVRRAEEHAVRLGCNLLYLETFTFQAPDFYARLGFRTALELPGFPDGASKLILTKELS